MILEQQLERNGIKSEVNVDDAGVQNDDRRSDIVAHRINIRRSNFQYSAPVRLPCLNSEGTLGEHRSN
jgi:hypothetical protein